MVKKSAPLLEVERLLDLVPYLSVNPYISLRELAEEFSVSEREISNELIALSMCGLPGYTPYELIDVSFDFGYVTINNHQSLDFPRALSSGELSAFLLGLNLIKDSLLNSARHANESQAKIELVESLMSRLLKFLDIPIEVELDTSSHFVSEIEKVINQRGSLSMRYLSSEEDEARVREIAPLALRREGLHRYIYAFCFDSNAYRSFRLDRVESLTAIPVSSSKNGSVELPRKESDDAGEYETKPEKIQLKIRKNKRRYAELFNLESIPVSGQVEVSIFSLSWLVRALCAAQDDVEVTRGPQISPLIAARSEKILALYQS